VVRRSRKDDRIGARYEVISNKDLIGEGGMGKVRKIKGTIALSYEDHSIGFKKTGKDGTRRAVKIQEHSLHSNSLSYYQKSIRLAKKANHMGFKDPSITKDIEQFTYPVYTSYTVMKIIPGCELFYINNDDCDGTNILSTQERIKLTKALLIALKEQVSDLGLIHRDIKPENIIVNLHPSLTVNIIDYDQCTDRPDGHQVGTEGFYAPETESNTMKITAKSDVYSMARVIALIWRVNAKNYNFDENDNHRYTPCLYKPQDTINGLFKGINELKEEDKVIIEYVLTRMLANNPEERFSIDEAISAFDLVGNDKKDVQGVLNDQLPQYLKNHIAEQNKTYINLS
jgi:serine/threonine protein kinase